MKTFTKFGIAAMAVAVGWGFYQDQFRAEENRMEALHQRVDIHRVDCTKTESLANHTWLACRWGDHGDWGSIWVLHEDGNGPIWLTHNGKAIQAVELYEKLPANERTKAIRVRRTTPEDIMERGFANLPSVPWDQLN